MHARRTSAGGAAYATVVPMQTQSRTSRTGHMALISMRCRMLKWATIEVKYASSSATPWQKAQEQHEFHDHRLQARPHWSVSSTISLRSATACSPSWSASALARKKSAGVKFRLPLCAQRLTFTTSCGQGTSWPGVHGPYAWREVRDLSPPAEKCGDSQHRNEHAVQMRAPRSREA